MMNRFIFISVLLFILSGCSAAALPEAETAPVQSSSTPAVTAEPAEETAAAVSAETTEIHTPETEPSLALSYDAYQVVYNIMEGNGEESGTFQGIGPDGNLAWSYDTGAYLQGQMPQISPLGGFQGTYYLLEGGRVIALDITTGQVLFENSDFGGCASQELSFIDEYGFLYLCGFDKPDFFIMDPMGHTVKITGTLDQDHYGPFKITQDGDTITVHMEKDSMGNSGDFPVSIPRSWVDPAKG